ncbi:hypothetical protein BpHYR1_037201 [Brachionus plicatilis]|uniref:Uncharacterized protein n=1 Tax=Brachionus plicatilis TaxID=10195 RepID=A0A3M7SI15_BRAPC|nr:hypothetical protein BpHYR1_037201 [Brachionus plicatilis]
MELSCRPLSLYRREIRLERLAPKALSTLLIVYCSEMDLARASITSIQSAITFSSKRFSSSKFCLTVPPLMLALGLNELALSRMAS